MSYRALIASLITQAVDDLKIIPVKKKRYKNSHWWYTEGCPKRAKEFIQSHSFIELCIGIDLNGYKIREKLNLQL